MLLPLLLATLAQAAPAPSGFGPFELEVGQDSLRFAFMGQLRLTYDDKDGAAGRTHTDRLTLQRVRPIVEGRFMEKKLQVQLQLNTGPTAVELLDLFAGYTFGPRLQLRVGQQKTPFTRHRQGSFARLTLVDWSPAVRYFGAERQLGVMLHDGFKSDDGLEYAVGVFSGVNARSAFARGPARVYGVALTNPSDLADPAPAVRVHPEVVARVGYHRGEDRFASDSDLEGGPLRLTTGLSVAWDLRPEVALDFAVRLAPELTVKLHGWSATAVGYAGFFEASQGGKVALGAVGGLVQTAYRFLEHFEVALRYSRVDTLARYRADAAAWAATQPDARPSSVEVEQELAGGVNIYLVDHQLKWQSDVALLLTAPGDRQDVEVRSQLQVMF
jgi:hypothetical protein